MSFTKSRRFSYPVVLEKQKTYVISQDPVKSIQTSKDKSMLNNVRLCESSDANDDIGSTRCRQTHGRVLSNDTYIQKKNAFKGKRHSSRVSSPGCNRSKNMPKVPTINKQDRALSGITKNVTKEVNLNETFCVNDDDDNNCRRNNGGKEIWKRKDGLNDSDTIFQEVLSDTSLSWDNFETDLGNIMENCINLERVLKEDIDTIYIDGKVKILSQEKINDQEKKSANEDIRKNYAEKKVNSDVNHIQNSSSGIMGRVETTLEKARSKITELFAETFCKIQDETERKLKATVKDIIDTNKPILEESQNQVEYAMDNLQSSLNEALGEVVYNADSGDCMELENIVTLLSGQLEESQRFIKYLEFSYTNLLHEAEQKITKQTMLISTLKTEIDAIALGQRLDTILKTQKKRNS